MSLYEGVLLNQIANTTVRKQLLSQLRQYGKKHVNSISVI